MQAFHRELKFVIMASFGCFGDSFLPMSQKDSQQQEPFWPRVKKRLKAKSKKKKKQQIKEEVNYALEVSAIGKSETVLKIFSIEAIKPAEIVEIEDQKELLNLKSLQQQRSWRRKLKSFSLPKGRNGKVIQDPHKSLVERNDSNEKEQSIEFHKKVKKKGASAPCTPQSSSGNSVKTPFHAHFDTTTRSTNSRINHLPAPQCLCDEIAQDESRQQLQDNNDGLGVSSSRSIVTISLSVLAVIMGCLAFSDRLVAVLCACLCWYLLPNFTKLHHHTASPTTLSNYTQRTNDGGSKSMKINLNKSVSDSDISNSKDYQKKVIMAGLLHRPRR